MSKISRGKGCRHYFPLWKTSELKCKLCRNKLCFQGHIRQILSQIEVLTWCNAMKRSFFLSFFCKQVSFLFCYVHVHVLAVDSMHIYGNGVALSIQYGVLAMC